MRIRVIIRVEHAASCEPFDDAQLLDPEQHEGRPDVIEKLDGNEQNPERNFVSLRLCCKCDAVMSNEHFSNFYFLIETRRLPTRLAATLATNCQSGSHLNFSRVPVRLAPQHLTSCHSAVLCPPNCNLLSPIFRLHPDESALKIRRGARTALVTLSSSQVPSGIGPRAFLVFSPRSRFIGCSNNRHDNAAVNRVTIPKTTKRRDGIVIRNGI